MKKALLLLVFLIPLLIFGQSIPDNILENHCNQPLNGNPWNIQLLASSSNNEVASYSSILVGDIDGNGITDIVVAKYSGNNYRSREINVYDGLYLNLQYTFTLSDTIYLSNGPYTIGRYPLSDGSLQGAIFTHCYDKRIRAYSIDGTLLNVSDRPTSCDGMVSLADFNGDGFPEVYSGSDIFDAATLKWLCSGPSDGNKGLSYRGSPHLSYGVYHHTYYAMSLAYNAIGDDNQELICGNTIYNVNIVSRTNPNLNSVTINKTISPPYGYSQDGHVCLGDFDLDGETEILVIRDDTNDQIVDNTYFYAYKPSNGHILFQKAHLCANTSYVFIGNIDTTPYPEIVLLENQPNGEYEKIFCWRYIPGGGLETIWSQYHEDRSGMTAMTLFDFNQDNIMELVYRDNNNLRIINASGISHLTGNDTIKPYNIYTRMMAAGTGCEYPVVADVNGDGRAEIIATGLLDQYFDYDVGYGNIYVFGSPDRWGSARPVWNQYMYHVTNVNEDLTIPKFSFNKATVFADNDGVIRRPYNNFLQQAGYITPQGEPYNPTGEVQTEFFAESCEPYIWNGITYDSTGQYQQTFTSTQGCDSIVTLNLTVNASYRVSEIHGHTHIYYLANGTFTYNIDPVEGCLGYEWHIDNPNWQLDASPSSPECSVNLNSPGVGTLRVRVYTECGYIERNLYINHDVRPDIVIYPNPTLGDFKIVLYGLSGETIIEIYDYLGQFIGRSVVDTDVDGTVVPYTLAGKTAGVYTVLIINNNLQIAKSVIKNTDAGERLYYLIW